VRTYAGTFLRAEDSGGPGKRVFADRYVALRDETFYLEKVDLGNGPRLLFGDRFRLRTTKGYYLRPVWSQGGRLYADAPNWYDSVFKDDVEFHCLSTDHLKSEPMHFPLPGYDNVATVNGGNHFGEWYDGLDVHGYHTGTDFGFPGVEGSNVVCAASGRIVLRQDTTESNGWGKTIVIQAIRSDGGIEFHRYGHLQSFAEPENYAVGNWLNVGTLIGKVGHTGRVTGPHLHFERSPTLNSPGYMSTPPANSGYRPPFVNDYKNPLIPAYVSYRLTPG
jgi:murein DD-endopeptidase MepM/ murein hydrolase activator NlpD